MEHLFIVIQDLLIDRKEGRLGVLLAHQIIFIVSIIVQLQSILTCVLQEVHSGLVSQDKVIRFGILFVLPFLNFHFFLFRHRSARSRFLFLCVHLLLLRRSVFGLFFFHLCLWRRGYVVLFITRGIMIRRCRD